MPSTTYTFRPLKEGDTYGTVELTVLDGLASLAGATATFSAADEDGDSLIHEASATISATTTASDGTKGCTLTYALTDGVLTATVGRARGEFTITYSGGAIETVPSGPVLMIEIVPSYRLMYVAPAP
jgi:hypothetical protein